MMAFLTVPLVLAGLFFFFAGTIGVLRLPDFYSRVHAAGKCDSLAAVLLIVALSLHTAADFSFLNLLVALKILLIAVFIFMSSPTATHAITEAAMILGIKPWEKGGEQE